MKKAEKRKQLIKEHKRLVSVLRSPSHEDDKKEAKIQSKELKEYEDAEKSKGRCWTGYKPAPGKKPYSKGSCVKKSKVTPKEFALLHKLLRK